jgi:hypothetical protein
LYTPTMLGCAMALFRHRTIRQCESLCGGHCTLKPIRRRT